MGWVASVAGTLIVAMFVYHWLTKDTTSASIEEVKQAQNSSRVKLDGHDGSISIERTAKEPALQKQPLPTGPRIDTEQPSISRDERNSIKPEVKSKPSERTAGMSPPALPTITSPPTAMGPPPRSQSPPRLKPPTVGRLPAAPRPGGGALRPPPSAASSLRVPLTKVLPNTSMAPSSLMPPPKKVSKQVILEPGHSPLDWAALTTNPSHNLRGKDAPDNLIKVTPSRLKAQNGRKGTDAWTVYQGKVYNISPYIPFHPGGKGELLRGAGKDSAKLFMEVHPWVNWDGMLAECCVGIMVSEEEGEKESVTNRLDEMD